MELGKDFVGVPAGEIYPRTFKKGEDCPPELEGAARASGCLKVGKTKAKTETEDAADTVEAE